GSTSGPMRKSYPIIDCKDPRGLARQRKEHRYQKNHQNGEEKEKNSEDQNSAPISPSWKGYCMRGCTHLV
ncbi:MAG: hypothetical protein ACLPWS_10760, partial [Rhodomicrobium sp.]